jgi:F-type H+-transporting ATPase subunit b
MLQTLNTFGESSSGLSALGVDAHAFVIQLITFVLALLVLKRYAFKPIVKMLNERRELIEGGVKLGEEMRVEKSTFEAKMEKLMTDARAEADNILAAAKDSGQQVVREAEDKAKQKAALVIEEAERRIEQERSRMRKQLEGELANLVADATEAVLDQKVDNKTDMELIEKAIRERSAV